LTKSAIKTQSV